MLKRLFLPFLIFAGLRSFAQQCNCETEFRHLESFMKQNYAGFKDKKAAMTDAGYHKLVDEYLNYTKAPHSSEQCLMILSRFLDHFKDEHVSIRSNVNANTIDSIFIKQRQIITINDKQYSGLLKSTSRAGIYYFNWDTTAYKIAVVKSNDPLYDYQGIIVSSNLPGWKKGMLKLEGKMINDSTMKGVLYMRNQLPKIEWFTFSGDALYGDWQRVGTSREKKDSKYVPVDSKKLSDKTLYIKISSFSPGNSKNIDSIFKLNAEALKTMPYLVLDLRGNGGGADYTYFPILSYIYTNPVKEIGVDVLSTDANITGWKKLLDDPDMSVANKNSIAYIIRQMENNKGKWVNTSGDVVISDYKKLPNPTKVVILIDKGSASTTEQFLLFARQSSKVILMGQNTSGTLDYSNVREAPLDCMPYILNYSTSRSRRLDVSQGIDNVGIKPDKYLDKKVDWVSQAVLLLEK